MYDDVLFPVSFYLLDDRELAEHGKAVVEAFDADVHVFSVVLDDESRTDREDHREAFDRFVDDLGEGTDVTRELRGEPVPYDEVADAIVAEAEDYDLIVMGHTRVRESSEPTTAERVINAAQAPTVVVPLKTPRFRGST